MLENDGVRTPADEPGIAPAPVPAAVLRDERMRRTLVRAIWLATIAILGFTVFLVWQVTLHPKGKVLTPAQQLIVETRAAIKKAPKSPRLHNQLGELLHYEGDLKGARKSFETALKYQKDYGPAIRNIAAMDWYDGKKDKAIASLKAYLTRVPGDAEGWFALGSYQQEKELWADAAQSYNDALKHAPNDSAAHYRLGLCLEKLGKRDEAIDNYRKALRFVPDYQPAAEALTRLGVTQ